MKYLIVSDIHGDFHSADIIINKFNELKCDYIICLGDVLYHGPRNDLPNGYAPKEVIKLFNRYADKFICINGNCDAEVDQMVLNFKIHKSLDLELNGISFHLEHGHHLDEYFGHPQAILYGHTHVKKIENLDGIYYLNPGSISLPKDGLLGSYMVLDNNEITLFDINDEVLNKIIL